MDIVQWYGIALAALAAIMVAASHLRPLLPFWLLRHIVYPRLHPLVNITGDTTRLGAMVLVVFLTGNVLCGGIGVENSSDLAKRTGQLFIINAIPLFLGGKIGPLVNILHIQYEDYARAHRWLGRVAAAHAVVHITVAVSAKPEFRSLSQLAGLIAASALCAIILLSVGVLWRLKYELFAKLHGALAVLTLVTTWMHVASGSILRPPAAYMLAACCTYGSASAVWFMHIVYRNYSIRGPFTRAKIFKTGASSTQVVLLELELPRPCNFRSGQFVYVRFLTLRNLAFLQSHPFYVYSWEEDRLFLLVEMKSGFTASLLTENTPLLQERGTSMDEGSGVRAMVEGPFGKPVDLQSYSTIALFATDIGIVTQFSYLRKWLRDLQGPFKVHTERITLFWEVKAEAHIYWVKDDMDELLKMDVKHMLRIHVFVVDKYISRHQRRGETRPAEKVNHAWPDRVFTHYYPIDAEAQVKALLEKPDQTDKDTDKTTTNFDERTVIAVCSDSLTTASIRREVCRATRKNITLEIFDVVPGRRQTYGESLRALFRPHQVKQLPTL